MLEIEILIDCPNFREVPNTRDSTAKVEDNNADLVNGNTPQGEIHIEMNASTRLRV